MEKISSHIEQWLKVVGNQKNYEIELRWKCGEGELANLLKFYKDTKLPREHLLSTDTIFDNDIRISVDQCDITSTIQKSMIKRETIITQSQKGILTLSKENVLEDFITPITLPILVRQKDRWSFWDKSVRIDLTVVSENVHKNYEVEIELLVDKVKTDAHWNSRFNHAVTTILGFFKIIKVEKADYVLYNLINSKKFVGALPKTLHKKDLELLSTKSYAVSAKYDGTRRLLLIQEHAQKHGHVSIDIYDRNLKWCGKLETRLRNQQTRISNLPALLDAEEMIIAEETVLIIFDVIHGAGIDMRKSALNLHIRMDIVKDILNKLCKIPHHALNVKKYFSLDDMNESSFAELRTGLNTHLSDGYIFTPIKVPYSQVSRDKTLFKWKSPENSTVDFRFIRSNGKMSLLILEKDNKERIYRHGGHAKSFANTEFEHIDKPCIVECSWDYQKQRWRLVKVRHDKEYPNFITTADDVWMSIINPIHEGLLFSLARAPLHHKNSPLYDKIADILSNMVKEKYYFYSSDGEEKILAINENLILSFGPSTFNNGVFDFSLNGDYLFSIENIKPMTHCKNIQRGIDIEWATFISEPSLELLETYFYKVSQLAATDGKIMPSLIDFLQITTGRNTTTFPDVGGKSLLLEYAKHFNVCFSIVGATEVISPDIFIHDLVHPKQIIYLPCVLVQWDVQFETWTLHHICDSLCADGICLWKTVRAFSADNKDEMGKLTSIISQVTLN